MQTIYALTEPTGEVRYVGRTLNMANRFRQHLAADDGAMPAVNAWIRSMKSGGHEPLMVGLMVVDDESAAEWERQMIALHNIGGQLLNVHGTGAKSVPCAGAAALSAIMTARGLRQSDVARMLGVNQSTVSRWFRGFEPTLAAVLAIRDAFGIDPKSWFAAKRAA